ncbi:hypothetical protein HPB48_023059 [Haemaphysalis longicornis]|uniref:Uncharacterized protein n=1 Tax=Haemaphysalis longicornis TaxID=44386 RepID=A0A9J6GK16_HAELO|nr:hypothetical protein HPB48_023059 [Haemaphysalis longicornis]
MPSDSSPQATSAAASDRFSCNPPATSGLSGSSAYRTLLNTLSTGKLSENALFLHGDPSVRPYGVDDFTSALQSVTDLRALDCLGLFQYNEVWTITFNSENEMQSLATQTEIFVKGKRCLVINPSRREVAVKVHWLPPRVPGGLIVRQLECFDHVQRVVRDGWRKSALPHMTGTSRVYHIIPSAPRHWRTSHTRPLCRDARY